MPATAFKLSVAAPNAPLLIEHGGEDTVCSVVFEVSSAVSLSTIPRIGISPSGTTMQNVQYVNFATGAVLAAGTAITANGVYGVYSAGCRVDLISTTGSADVSAYMIYGRVF